MVERGRPQMTMRRTRIACRIPKAKHTLSGHVIHIALPCNSSCTNALPYYITYVLRVLLFTSNTKFQSHAVCISANEKIDKNTSLNSHSAYVMQRTRRSTDFKV